MTASPRIAKEARFILTNLANNNNKFWNIRLFPDGACEVHWGRVGEAGQRQTKTGVDEAWFDARCREKEGKGYQRARTLGNSAGDPLQGEALARAAAEQIEVDGDDTRALIRRLARANVHRILAATTMAYDESRGTFSTPLGIVTEDGIADARALLARISGFVARADYDDAALAPLVDEYLMRIPQSLGRARLAVEALLPDLDAVQRQSDLLDALDASVKMAKVEDATPTPKLFEARLTQVTDPALVQMIADLYRDTKQSVHASAHLTVRRVFRIDLPAMRGAYERRTLARDNVRLLWHGTRTGNLLSLLKSGFVIPPANASHCTGRMFGNGVYFSDQSTKALNYAYGYWGGGDRDARCFMLLCNVALGKSYTPKSWQESFPKPGHDSTFAKAGVSGVQNNEFIVYDTAQIDPTYLVEFGPEEA